MEKGQIVRVKGQEYLVHIPATADVDMFIAYRLPPVGVSSPPRQVFDLADIDP